MYIYIYIYIYKYYEEKRTQLHFPYMYICICIYIYIYIFIQFKVTKMKHAWFPVNLSFVLTHSSDRFNGVWRVRKHETQCYRESCVFHFSHFELCFALHSCVLSTFQQHSLPFPTIIYVHTYIIILLDVLVCSFTRCAMFWQAWRAG